LQREWKYLSNRTVKYWTLAVLVLALFAGAAAGCGSSGSSGEATFPRDGGGSSDLDGTFNTDTGLHLGDDGGTDGPQGALTITPIAPTVTITSAMPMPTLQFNAFVGGQPATVGWMIDRGELGSINAAGLFTPAGNVAGVGNITASYGSLTATTTITVQITTTQLGDPAWTSGPLDAGAGGYGGVGGNGPGATPTATQVTTLNGTATADATVTFLYPYDGTAWPQGLLAPLLQWYPSTHAFDSVYVDLKETNYEYKGYFAANTTPFVNLPIPQAAWDTLGFSNGGEAVTVTLVFAQGTNVYGPYTESWKIAPATLQGTIYYNSYGTSLVKNSGTDGLDHYGNQYGAGTLAIAPGATSPSLVAGVNSVASGGNGTGCRVCHTVSADGKSLFTQASNSSASDYSDTVYVNLANDTTGGAGTSTATANLAFPAIFKDGSLLLSSSGGMINGDSSSRLYTAPAGTLVPGVTGLPANFQAALPAFSPDGKHVSFNTWGGTIGTTASDEKSLGIFDFDGTNTFSNGRVLYTPPSGNEVTYSSFLPSGTGIVFELGLSTPSNFGFTWHNNTAELWWLDVASSTAHRLDQLNGYGASGSTYLPDNASGMATHTAAQDATLNYEATVNPIGSGGYAWVVFTSRRMYGNVAQIAPWTSDPRDYPWRDQVTDKKLWVAAVDLNAPAGTDPSHPAFYLPAQELYAGNARGYWSVEACHADGETCQAGDQCCGGYCQPGDGGLVCSSQMPMCSGEYERCTMTSDCCGAAQGIVCIDMVCTQNAPH
jgi:hypothetical protein